MVRKLLLQCRGVVDGICDISHPGLKWPLLAVSVMPHSPGFPLLWLLLLNLYQFLCSKCPCPLFSGFCWDLVSIHHPSYLPLGMRSLNPTASITIFDDPQILVSSPDSSLKLWTQRLSILLHHAAGWPTRDSASSESASFLGLPLKETSPTPQSPSQRALP